MSLRRTRRGESSFSRNRTIESLFLAARRHLTISFSTAPANTTVATLAAHSFWVAVHGLVP